MAFGVPLRLKRGPTADRARSSDCTSSGCSVGSREPGDVASAAKTSSEQQRPDNRSEASRPRHDDPVRNKRPTRPSSAKRGS